MYELWLWFTSDKYVAWCMKMKSVCHVYSLKHCVVLMETVE